MPQRSGRWSVREGRMDDRQAAGALKTGALIVLGVLVVFGAVSSGLFDQQATDDGCGPVLSMTFDDGYRSVYTEGFPVLRSMGVEATTYAITDHVGDRFEGRPLMTWSQLQDLKDADWEVGSHSQTHPDLRDVSDSRLQREVKGSYQDLADQGFAPSTMAAPYGFTDERVEAAVMSQYDGFRVTRWGANDIADPERGSLNAHWLHENLTWDQVRPELINDTLDHGWGILMLHSVNASSQYAYSVDPATLRAVVETARANDIDIKPVEEVLEEDC